jgi:hypothetical protein
LRYPLASACCIVRGHTASGSSRRSQWYTAALGPTWYLPRGQSAVAAACIAATTSLTGQPATPAFSASRNICAQHPHRGSSSVKLLAAQQCRPAIDKCKRCTKLHYCWQ